MLRFLVQSFPREFLMTLENAKEYYSWLGKEELEIKIWNEGDLEAGYIPVGSVEFVSAYLNRFYPEQRSSLIPLNVPEILFPYANRRIANKDLSLFSDVSSVFIKDLNTIKHPGNGLREIGEINVEKEDIQISEVVDIDSEWRIFVFHSQILYLSCYSGDVLVFPDRERIEDMVSAYCNSPVAYTLDVGVEKYRGTFVIECHRFFSCGLYGFSDYKRIPKMLSQTWFQMINKYD